MRLGRYTLIGSSVSFCGPPILKIRNDLCFSIRSNSGGGAVVEKQKQNAGRWGVGWVAKWVASVFLSLSLPLLCLLHSALLGKCNLQINWESNDLRLKA